MNPDKAKIVAKFEKQRQAKLAARMALRGLKYCGCPKRSGGDCQSVIHLNQNTCAHHDPDRMQSSALELIEYEKRAAEAAIDAAKKRAAELAVDVPRWESYVQALRAEVQEIKSSLSTQREALTLHTVTLQRKQAEFRAQHEGAADALLRRAQAYLGLQDDQLSPDIAAEMVRCAEAITNHQREQRLARLSDARPVPELAAPASSAERIRDAGSPAERLTVYRRAGRSG